MSTLTPEAPPIARDEARWESVLRKLVVVIGRIALAYLFFSQLWWKLPPTYGCPADFALKKEDGKFIAPNIRWFGSVIFWSEFAIFASLFLGLFTRLGGLIALGVSTQLTLGLAGITIPGDYEWEWAYIQMIVLSLMMIGLTPGRYFGLDALLRRWLKPAADRGNVLAKLVLLGT